MRIDPPKLFVDIAIAAGIFVILTLLAQGQVAATILIIMPLIFPFFAGHGKGS